MQVPERLALIGGSILLASTLIFTLKSQASSIIPHVGHSIGDVYQDITNTNAEHGALSFDEAYQNAQKQGWQTGQWGSSKYYIDKDMNMHVGEGKLSSTGLASLLGNDTVSKIRTLNIDQPVQAPQDSTTLFSTSPLWSAHNHSDLTVINGLSNVDTSHVTNMTSMFCFDDQLKNLNGIENWDTSKLNDISTMFVGMSVSNINLSNWHINNNLGGRDSGHVFVSNSNLRSIDLSNFDTSDISEGQLTQLFGSNSADWSTPDTNLSSITLGNKTVLSDEKTSGNLSYLPSGTWQNGNQTLNSIQLMDGNPHPGTWIKQ